MSGRLIVMGSGELAPGLVATHRATLEVVAADKVLILDTPYGFQENADQLSERILSFFPTSLGVEATVASLRGRDASPAQRERFLAAIRGARYVFAGPGSPTYALEIWRQVGAGAALSRLVQSGGAICFASGAALTLGRKTLPVYEIYKVGAQPHWLEGLDVTSALGIPCTIVPHWNNAEGGTHDTSRCYVGERRFAELAAGLDAGVVGVDEHTAACFDFATRRLEVTGLGTVTLRAAASQTIPSGRSVELARARKLLSAAPLSRPQPRSRATEHDFRTAVAQGDAEGVLNALLEVESAGAAARSDLRAMLVELVELG